MRMGKATEKRLISLIFLICNRKKQDDINRMGVTDNNVCSKKLLLKKR